MGHQAAEIGIYYQLYVYKRSRYIWKLNSSPAAGCNLGLKKTFKCFQLLCPIQKAVISSPNGTGPKGHTNHTDWLRSRGKVSWTTFPALIWIQRSLTMPAARGHRVFLFLQQQNYFNCFKPAINEQTSSNHFLTKVGCVGGMLHAEMVNKLLQIRAINFIGL